MISTGADSEPKPGSESGNEFELVYVRDSIIFLILPLIFLTLLTFLSFPSATAIGNMNPPNASAMSKFRRNLLHLTIRHPQPALGHNHTQTGTSTLYRYSGASDVTGPGNMGVGILYDTLSSYWRGNTALGIMVLIARPMHNCDGMRVIVRGVDGTG
ncbi:hypothetical protein EX30DRAFT_349308 [Ascodesmis nigricans]|uniref:Uncharacterized protein n=1 Tax=Ascodesmis nigricans TaxID=341454 RepID=A0A4S2MVA5_9PEZI|nr:hypothetical protein EX30DRAFT_349308 [Ascodesmis nigricans]